eukprot:960707-Amphidinium_carterae.1
MKGGSKVEGTPENGKALIAKIENDRIVTVRIVEKERKTTEDAEVMQLQLLSGAIPRMTMLRALILRRSTVTMRGPTTMM